MKLLTIAIPSYNSQAYLAHAVESLLPGGNEVEILIVDDGSTDDTPRMADEFEARYPGVVRAIHKPNGGHGDAVMTGLANATGLYFKVVDSDDWVDEKAYPEILNTLRASVDEPLDMLISNYIYDKVGAVHPFVMNYRHILPQNRVFGWEETRRFRKGRYILMHSVIYRTQLLHECHMTLPKHTFYVDDLYVYVPLKDVKRIRYVDQDFYHYFIGRDDQSVQTQVMIRRIDQYVRVNKLLITGVDLEKVTDPHLRRYMLNFLEIITAASSALLIEAGTPDHLAMKDELWRFIERESPYAYRHLRKRMIGRLVNRRDPFCRSLVRLIYRISQKIYGFN